MNFVFLMDPLHTVIMHKDTTFILMHGAHERGHKVFFLPNGGMTLKNGKIEFLCVSVIPQKNEQQPFIEQHKATLTENDVDAVFIRTDPPFDHQYLMNTWLLDRLSENTVVINDPHGIRTVNEKIWATQFTSIIPPTLVGRNKDSLFSFLKEEKEVVAKPTDGFGGQSVFHIREKDKNTHVILETLTQNWTRDIVVQKYIKETQNGDKRILLLNGEPLGAVLRMHSEDDHRNNFFSGGKPLAAEITARDKEIIATIKPDLKKLGLDFVGIDIIGDYLIEVNVTSPTCMQEMNDLYRKNLEYQVIEFVENLVEQNKSKVKITN